MHIEIWIPLLYKGNISRYNISTEGRIYDTQDHDFVKTFVDKKGYIHVNLRFHYNRNKVKTYRLHRIMASVFLPNPENKPQVNHIDGDKSNNAIWNLEWVTSKENVKHAFETGLHPIYSCDKSSHHIYTNEEIENVCKFMYEYPNVYLKDIEKMFGIKYSTLQNLKLHRSWKDISCKYNFKNRLDFNVNKELREETDKLLIKGSSIDEIIQILNPLNMTRTKFRNFILSRKYQLYKNNIS